MSSSDLFQNLDNIQKNFDPQPLLNDQQLVAFGIEYSNSVLSKLNMVLEPNRQQYLPIKRFFAGHRGCGKSTLLYQCAQSQQDKYFTVLFSISDIGDIIDVDHINILFAIGVNLLEAAEQRQIDIPIKITQSFERWFNNVVGTETDTSGGELALDLAVFKLKLKRESETRQEIRKKFERKANELVGEIDRIASAITAATSQEILVIIDDLDKISRPDIAIPIYSDNLSVLLSPNFSIIYTLPIAFYRDMTIMGSLEKALPKPVILMPVLKLAPKNQRRNMPPDYSSPAIELLLAALDRRLPEKFKDIIPPAIARQIVLLSGGVLRELVRIMYQCLEICKMQAYEDPALSTLSVDETILAEAIRDTRLEFQSAIGAADYDILVETYQEFSPIDPGDERFLNLLHRLYILEYRNDDLWYDVHPIIEDLLRRQSKI
jgi:hypothetical protein